MNENNMNVQATCSASIHPTAYAWTAGTMQQASSACVGVHGTENTVSRMYLRVELPDLPRNPRIQKAELTVYQNSSTNELAAAPRLGLFQVTEDIAEGLCTPAHDSNPIDFALMKASDGENTESVSYTFDITGLVNAINKGETDSRNLVLKLMDESVSADSFAELCGSGDSALQPVVSVTYEASYGVNSAHRTHSHDLSRFGQGSIDLACGNLIFESQDFAWAGNRMPVTLKRMYNSALCDAQYTCNDIVHLKTADFSAMKLGYGWKLNVMQSMVTASDARYVYTGENGDEIYFELREGENSIYEAVGDSDMVYDSENRTLVQGEETRLFDDAGRLIRISDEHSSMDIAYTDGRITAVTDGAGRTFHFAYSEDGQLTSITAPDNTSVSYTYADDFLHTVTYPDGTKAVITYADNKPASVAITDAEDTALYTVSYTFNGDRVSRVAEYGGADSVEGKWSAYDYSAAARRTVVQSAEKADDGETQDQVMVTVYAFDDAGNIISEYIYAQDTPKLGAEGSGSGIHPHFGDSGVHAVRASQNRLTEHSFEGTRSWQIVNEYEEEASVSVLTDRNMAKYGEKMLCIQSGSSDVIGVGAFKRATLSAGTYTFSAYLRPVSGTGSVYLNIVDLDGNVLAESEHLSGKEADYVRMSVSFDLEEDKELNAQILYDGEGTAYADAAQLEANPFATPYNLLEDSGFDAMDLAWTLSDGADYDSDTCFNQWRSMKITGDLDAAHCATQTLYVRTDRTTRESFTLSGWAKGGNALPSHQREGCADPQFRLRAVVHYNDAEYEDESTETFTADFCSGTGEWQHASVSFSKSKYRTVDHIEVFCDYDYNCGEAWFDDLQLIRDGLETGLTPSDFPEEDYDESDAEETEDAYALPTFEELTDEFGNPLTETTFTDGAFGTVYRSRAYDEKGNDLIRETDARGNVTTYTVDPVTSRNQAVTDRCGNQTAYAYDAVGRTAKVTARDAQGEELAEVSYTYDAFDNLTEILRGDGMKYVLNYNEFHNLSSIGVSGKEKPLVSYAYKTGNGRLKQITYANGDTMKATYNSLGHLIAEKWYDSADALTAHYQYGYDSQGNIVRTVDIFREREYIYTYEDGKLVCAAEYAITFSEDGFIASRSKVITLRHSYNEQGAMVRKTVTFPDGTELVTLMDTDSEDAATHIRVNGAYISSISKTDAFGRKEFDELQLGSGLLSRHFRYHDGKITDEHKANGKVKSAPTTHLVSRITFSDGRSLSYEYDAEERITEVVERDGDTVVTTTAYTYDAQGQLLTETVNGESVNRMFYDAYGNILSKNGVAYQYGDSRWKDKLSAYDGQYISYDSQGNPIRYLGHELRWEKGRQLKSFDGNTYTYNANGIRTSKTIDGVTHTYALDGVKVLREVWDDNELIPLYDNEESVCGILFNEVPYYFQKNLQGDIIAITDAAGLVLARYAYDAWGKCTITDRVNLNPIVDINPYRYRGYYFDTEIGMYYLQSRYYDPEVGRFINEDEATFCVVANKTNGHHLFVYCYNNPINHEDDYGFAVDIIFDIVSAVFSLIDLIANPSWINAGFFVWDLVAIFLSCIPGSYVAKFGKLAIKVASKIDDFADGSKFLTGSYKKLKNLFKGIKNIEIHHLVEKRFKSLFKKVKNTDDYLSIPLTKELHRIITNRWRKIFPYGTNYKKITKSRCVRPSNVFTKICRNFLRKRLSGLRKIGKNSFRRCFYE